METLLLGNAKWREKNKKKEFSDKERNKWLKERQRTKKGLKKWKAKIWITTENDTG